MLYKCLAFTFTFFYKMAINSLKQSDNVMLFKFWYWYPLPNLGSGEDCTH